jgi:hypothetical protein
VGFTRFKSPLVHQYNPRPDVGLYGIRGRTSGPMVAPGWHRLSSEALPSLKRCSLLVLKSMVDRAISPYARPDLQPVAARPPQAGALFTTARRAATLRLRADVAVNPFERRRGPGRILVCALGEPGSFQLLLSEIRKRM